MRVNFFPNARSGKTALKIIEENGGYCVDYIRNGLMPSPSTDTGVILGVPIFIMGLRYSVIDS
jgi:hypothetical protein